MAQGSPNNLQNVQDQVAVLAAELEALKANSLKNNSQINSKNNLINTDLASIELAKMDLHLALSELGQGGDLKLILRFLNDAKQELLLGHRLVESKLLDSVVESLKNNQNSQDQQINQAKQLASFNDLIKSLGTLSFVLPVDPQEFNQVKNIIK